MNRTVHAAEVMRALRKGGSGACASAPAQQTHLQAYRRDDGSVPIVCLTGQVPSHLIGTALSGS